MICVFFFFKQKTAYEMRISDWSSDVCSSDLGRCSSASAEMTAGWARGIKPDSSYPSSFGSSSLNCPHQPMPSRRLPSHCARSSSLMTALRRAPTPADNLRAGEKREHRNREALEIANRREGLQVQEHY